uniref:Uncharacterized protein n=1 Tax=Candidatus Kentrum sp. DK TaxID=2126562 RepID=A0A450RZX0_9GAMM|nr:MAG: hypothetical protein BECKDK2373C_GA0170839_10099 [Candidatus Kentron sp. DK]
MTHSLFYPRGAGGRQFPPSMPVRRPVVTAIILIGLLAGCAGPVELTRIEELPCPNCRPVTDIHTESFLRLAADANGACIIHRYQGKEEDPARWHPWLAPLARLIGESQVHLHLWRGESPDAERKNVARAKALRAIYRETGAREPKGSLYSDPRLFLPPYHALCRSRSVDGPVLELGEHARLLSGRGTPPVAADAATAQAMNTLIVTLHRRP